MHYCSHISHSIVNFGHAQCGDPTIGQYVAFGLVCWVSFSALFCIGAIIRMVYKEMKHGRPHLDL